MAKMNEEYRKESERQFAEMERSYYESARFVNFAKMTDYQVQTWMGLMEDLKDDEAAMDEAITRLKFLSEEILADRMRIDAAKGRLQEFIKINDLA